MSHYNSQCFDFEVTNTIYTFTVTPVGVNHVARLFAEKAVSLCHSAGVEQAPSEECMRSIFEKTSSAYEVSYESSKQDKIN